MTAGDGATRVGFFVGHLIVGMWANEERVRDVQLFC